MDWKEFSAKTTEEAIEEACIALETTSDKLEYEVIEKESRGFLGFGSKPARIRARKSETLPDRAKNFLESVLTEMGIQAQIEIDYREEDEVMDINLVGNDMGILIGKRGQTLDSLQYLVSLVVNKQTTTYVKVKLDTENYRKRRKETLENLAHNIAAKVKRIHKSVALEPMNPYERRIIHSALQNDKYVETHSEGEEPYRKVVVTLKKGVRDYSRSNGRYNKSSYGQRRSRGYDRRDRGFSDFHTSEPKEETAAESVVEKSEEE